MEHTKEITYPASYYVRAFKQLDETGQSNFNWSAAIFGPFWALYRKMYVYAIPIVMILPINVSFSAELIGLTHERSKIGLIWIIYQLIFTILYGRYGNRIYYNFVKKRIYKGYHLVEEFSATISPTIVALISCSLPFISFWTIMLYLTLADFLKNKTHPSSIHIILAIIVAFILIMCLYSKIDGIVLNKFKKKHKSLDTQISEENIQKYLLQDSSSKYFKILNTVLLLPPLISTGLALYAFVILYLYGL